MPRQTPTVTYYETQERPGLFSRIFNRSRTTNPGSPMMIDPATSPTTTTTMTAQGNIVTASATMTPMYDRRGRITGWQPVNPVPGAPSAVAMRAEPVKPGETTINPAKTTPQTTTAAMTPMYDRRGRFIGWQQMNPAPVVTRTEPIRPVDPVAPAGNTVAKSNTTTPNGQVVQAGYPEPEQPRRGILAPSVTRVHREAHGRSSWAYLFPSHSLD